MTATKFASLTINSRLQPVLVVDPGSHLAIGKIIAGLKQMKTGLWPRHEGDTTLVITASQGREHELYKLAYTLPNHGYLLEETPQHKNLDQALAQRKAEIEARAAKAAIPPMEYVVKRFSFRPHPRGVQVSFFSHGDFTRWANANGIPYSNLCRHRAIIPHLPAGCGLKYDRTPKSTWIQPPVPTPEPETTPEPRPDSSWTKDRIKSWLEGQGVDTVGIVRKAELLELAQSI